ncbi:unnamed protein product [Protopolystoma xenopodis]|uniref:Uncharacterized protein n=1 Tax=Protopolystoma xenopodis TaxID=117903 RepID=A0A448XNY6_9PLAT|nr:unnamed protein product [Protopolystoma xenopodis]
MYCCVCSHFDPKEKGIQRLETDLANPVGCAPTCSESLQQYIPDRPTRSPESSRHLWLHPVGRLVVRSFWDLPIVDRRQTTGGAGDADLVNASCTFKEAFTHHFAAAKLVGFFRF